MKHDERETPPILEASHLTKVFVRGGSLMKKGVRFRAVDDVSFSLHEGEMLGLLGESGCGKTTLARMLIHLLEPSSGTILLDGVQVQDMTEHRFRKMRRLIQMVYQNPFDCLDPAQRIEAQLEEPIRIWQPDAPLEERKRQIRDMTGACGLPESCLKKKPAEFSGGQLQRICIARALLARPRVLIADEIISALDVPVQNQILSLLLKMKQMHDLSILFITHDLSVAKKVSDTVMVMQGGQIKGMGDPKTLFAHSEDPYIMSLERAVFTFSSNPQ